MNRTLTLSALGGLLLSGAMIALPSAAQAQGQLTVYCSVQEEWCRPMVEAFEKDTGIKVSMTRKSSGETYAQLKAEASNPKGDIWWGGTGDPHMQAAEEGLTEEYKSPNMANLQDWAVRQWNQTKGRTIGIYSGALGFAYNTKLIASKGIPDPKCWADLLDPKLKDEVQVADPNSSGTAYTMLATMVQLMGEEKGLAYMKELNGQVKTYTKSGTAPGRMAGQGECTVGITFLHDAIKYREEGMTDIVLSAPSEGTGYEIGAVGIIKGGPDQEAAKKFIDWILTKKAQEIGQTTGSYQFLTNPEAATPKQAGEIKDTKLINYDLKWAGTNRAKLVEKWNAAVN